MQYSDPFFFGGHDVNFFKKYKSFITALLSQIYVWHSESVKDCCKGISRSKAKPRFFPAYDRFLQTFASLKNKFVHEQKISIQKKQMVQSWSNTEILWSDLFFVVLTAFNHVPLTKKGQEFGKEAKTETRQPKFFLDNCALHFTD